MNEIFIGWLCVIGSILCFGSFGVPIKTPAVVDAKVHPIVFQSYKTFWAFLTSFIALTYNQFSFTPWGILSGLSWVPAGIGAIISVNCIGLGTAQGIWSGMIIIVSFSWGAFVFHEPLVSLPISILGIFLLALGITGMALCRLQFWLKLPICQGDYKQLNDDMLEQKPEVKKEEDWSITIGSYHISQKAVGYFSAVFNGAWGGSVMVPLKFAQSSVPTGIEYVFSFGVGAVLVNLSIIAIYFGYLHFIKKAEAPSFQLNVMAIPGSIAGILWSAGNYLSIYGVLFLGQAIGYPAVQAALIVSGLWGILYYKELKKVQIIVWALSALISISGIVILSQMKQ